MTKLSFLHGDELTAFQKGLMDALGLQARHTHRIVIDVMPQIVEVYIMEEADESLSALPPLLAEMVQASNRLHASVSRAAE